MSNLGLVTQLQHIRWVIGVDVDTGSMWIKGVGCGSEAVQRLCRYMYINPLVLSCEPHLDLLGLQVSTGFASLTPSSVPLGLHPFLCL